METNSASEKVKKRKKYAGCKKLYTSILLEVKGVLVDLYSHRLIQNLNITEGVSFNFMLGHTR